MIALRAAALALVLAGGCYLPIATGTPQPASTAGTGKFGVGFSGEAPTLDLTAGTSDFNDSYADAPAAAGKIEGAYGVADHTDVEASLEMSMYLYFLPMPVGGSIGLRQQLVDRSWFDLSAAARVGAVRVGGEDSQGREDSASAEFAQLAVTVQRAHGRLRPLIAISGMGARMTRNVEGVAQDFNGFSASATAGVMFQIGSVQFGPYVAATYFTSEAFSGRAFASGGLSVQIRPDRHAP